MSKESEYGQEIGPVEYIILAFDGNEFNGEIVDALHDIVDAGLIRVIDLAVINKDDEGDVTVLEYTELDGEVAGALEKLTGGEFTGLLSEEDLLMAADELPDNTTAAAMLFEHVWATQFATAVDNANGWLVRSVRIPPDVIDTARQTLIEASRNM